MECLKAVGIDSKGERKEFKIDSNGILYCYNEDLISLDISEGVKKIDCWNNKLTELNIPSSIRMINFSSNNIEEVIIPKGIKKIICDRHVLGLDNIDWECHIILF